MNLAPYYFDESKFTGYDARDGFFAQRALLEHYNGAAKLHMTWTAAGDSGADKQRKLKFSENWKNWRACLDAAETKLEKTAFHYLLRKPDDFLGFLYEIPEEILVSYFESYQAYLWNKTLKELVKTVPPVETMVSLKIPLLSAKTRMPDKTLEKIWREVLAAEKINTDMLFRTKFKKIRFLPGERAAVTSYC